MIKKILLVWLLLLSFSFLFAQEEAVSPSSSQIVQWWLDKPIFDIQFIGLKNIHETALIAFKKNILVKIFQTLFTSKYTTS